MGTIPVCEPTSSEQAGENGEEKRTSCFSGEVYCSFHFNELCLSLGTLGLMSDMTEPEQ